AYGGYVAGAADRGRLLQGEGNRFERPDQDPTDIGQDLDEMRQDQSKRRIEQIPVQEHHTDRQGDSHFWKGAREKQRDDKHIFKRTTESRNDVGRRRGDQDRQEHHHRSHQQALEERRPQQPGG